MTCTEEYKEHIEYTFHAFCKIVIRNASYTALRTWSRKHKREISLDYITDEKHYPLGTTDEYFKAPEPDEEYIVHLCGDTVILSNGLLVQALSRLPAQKQEMLYLSFFKRKSKSGTSPSLTHPASTLRSRTLPMHCAKAAGLKIANFAFSNISLHRYFLSRKIKPAG